MDSKSRILLVDDDQDVLELLEYNLVTNGYQVRCVDDARRVMKEALKFSPHLFVLDIMMPESNGIDICRSLRSELRFQDIPLFFLTARTESKLVEIALESGGDDLIHKMMGLQSLIMKINSVLKEGFVIKKRMDGCTIGPFCFDRRNSSVSVGHKDFQFSNNEFELLFLFAQNPSKVISARAIKNHIWGSDIFHVAAPIDDLIERISKKLEMNWITEPKEDHYRLNSRLI